MEVMLVFLVCIVAKVNDRMIFVVDRIARGVIVARLLFRNIGLKVVT